MALLQPVPLLDDRLANLHEAGRVLLDKYDGKFCNLLDACGKSAKVGLLWLVG